MVVFTALCGRHILKLYTMRKKIVKIYSVYAAFIVVIEIIQPITHNVKPVYAAYHIVNKAGAFGSVSLYSVKGIKGGIVYIIDISLMIQHTLCRIIAYFASCALGGYAENAAFLILGQI